MRRDQLLGSPRTGSYLDHFDPSYTALFLELPINGIDPSAPDCAGLGMSWMAYGKLLAEAQEMRGTGERPST
jgi:hypothetical protein